MVTPSSSRSGAGDAEQTGEVAGALCEAQRLFDQGCAALRSESFDDAAECFSKALEIRVQHYGDLAPECATTYYKYGCALFDKLQAEADPLCETVQNKGGPSSNPEGSGKAEMEDDDEDGEEATKDGDEGEEEEGEGEEEEEGDLEDAWKMLEFARVIHEKHGCCTIETVDIITKLADVNCFKENYKTCYDDYARALQILKQLVEPDCRILVELHFKIAVAHQLDLNPKEALVYCSHAISICEARVQRLRSELAIKQAQRVELLDSKICENGRTEEVQQRPEDIKSDQSDQEKDQKYVAEITEIEELLVDLKEKAEELREMASAPSLMEALQAANPEAVASMKQLVSLATGSIAGASGLSDDAAMSNNAPSVVGTSSSSTAVVGREVNGFDAPSLMGASSSAPAVVTHLGVVGRGVKRADPVAMAGGSGATKAGEPQPKKRSLDNLMNGNGLGDTQVGFGGRPAGSTNGGNCHDQVQQ